MPFVTSSDALVPSSFLLLVVEVLPLVVMPSVTSSAALVPSSFLLLVVGMLLYGSNVLCY